MLANFLNYIVVKYFFSLHIKMHLKLSLTK